MVLKMDLFSRDCLSLVGLIETNTNIITLKIPLINLVMCKKLFNLHPKQATHFKDIKKATSKVT